ncbi:MAG: hypothetical protein AAGG09_21855 [Pseudomonadota bacterium]
MYVSITGLRLHHPLKAPRFWWHAVRAMAQAQADPGCRQVDARKIDGVHHTRSLWESEAAMRAYLTRGAHLRAMKQFRRIATGGTIGFEADALPDWEACRRIWEDQARQY